jgi:hypothetical protein
VVVVEEENKMVSSNRHSRWTQGYTIRSGGACLLVFREKMLLMLIGFYFYNYREILGCARSRDV